MFCTVFLAGLSHRSTSRDFLASTTHFKHFFHLTILILKYASFSWRIRRPCTSPPSSCPKAIHCDGLSATLSWRQYRSSPTSECSAGRRSCAATRKDSRTFWADGFYSCVSRSFHRPLSLTASFGWNHEPERSSVHSQCNIY